MGFEEGNEHGKDTRFQPGESGNPEGKKKGTFNLTTSLRKLMDAELEIVDPITKEKVKKPIGEIINLKIIANAIKGDQRALKMVHERLEGLPKQDMKLTADFRPMPVIKKNGKEIHFDIGDEPNDENTDSQQSS